MPTRQLQMFGGDWTEQKLKMLQDYLQAYTTALRNQPFRKIYIDAFAGTGYRELLSSDLGFLADLASPEPQAFLAGSAARALAVEPYFDQYVFIERKRVHFAELKAQLKEQFPSLTERMKFINDDCNTVLKDICHGWSSSDKAVLFLDPFGMQVKWSTLQAIAATKCIDVWVLVPLAGMNRLLKRDGIIPPGWQDRLTKFFGTEEWFPAFYEVLSEPTLFGQEPSVQKTGSLASIADFCCRRLRAVFPAVAGNPKALYNSRRSPLFLLCFAVSSPNPAAKRLAMRIANHILGKS